MFAIFVWFISTAAIVITIMIIAAVGSGRFTGRRMRAVPITEFVEDEIGNEPVSLAYRIVALTSRLPKGRVITDGWTPFGSFLPDSEKWADCPPVCRHDNEACLQLQVKTGAGWHTVDQAVLPESGLDTVVRRIRTTAYRPQLTFDMALGSLVVNPLPLRQQIGEWQC